eukprot:158522_1
MGGAVATRLAMKYPNSYKGLMMICPMIQIDDNIRPSRFVEWIFKKLVSWFPKRRWTPAVDAGPWLISEKGHKHRLKDQVLKWRGPARLKTAYEMLQTTKEIAENKHLLRMDFIVLHGLEDKVTPCKLSQDLVNARKNSTDATMKVYDKSYHMLWWEPCADQMHSDMLFWLNDKCQ